MVLILIIDINYIFIIVRIVNVKNVFFVNILGIFFFLLFLWCKNKVWNVNKCIGLVIMLYN